MDWCCGISPLFGKSKFVGSSGIFQGQNPRKGKERKKGIKLLRTEVAQDQPMAIYIKIYIFKGHLI